MPGKLIVVVPAIHSRKKYWEALFKTRLSHEPELNGTEWFFWDHGAGLFSFKRAEAMAHELHAILDARHHLYSEIILVGHSLGGVVARAAYLMSVDPNYIKTETTDWGHKVTRLVLFASLNKGVDPQRVPFGFISIRLVNVLSIFRKLLVTDIWIGSAFITNLRIGWIGYFGSLPASRQPEVIQMLGTKDGLVSADDSIDVVQFRNAKHISIPGANHGNLYRLDVLKDPMAKDIRYEIIKKAIVGQSQVLMPVSNQNLEQKFVVFILPGIRDASSRWTVDLRDRFIAAQSSIIVEIANYGYFSAAKFFLPWIRRKNVRVFQDQYSECLARHPSAEFNCICHSNGSYILGRSLKYLPRMKFNRVFLAGSVLPEDYDWGKCFNHSQVREVRNDRAAKDWPVAILCKGMQGLGMKDVGVGGFDGFRYQVIDNHYYTGGHSDAIQPNNHSAIVEYIIKGQNKVELRGEVSDGFRLLSNLSPWLVKLFALFALSLIVFSTYLIFNNNSSGYFYLTIVALFLTTLYVLLDII